MPKTGVLESSVIQMAGEKKRVKLIAKKDPSGGYQYDVTINNTVEYKDIDRKPDAMQLYRTAKKKAKKDLQGTSDSGGGRGGLMGGSLFGGDTSASSEASGPSLPGFSMAGGDGDRDDESDGGPQLPGFGGMDGNEGGSGPTLPGFGGMMADDEDDDREEDNAPTFPWM